MIRDLKRIRFGSCMSAYKHLSVVEPFSQRFVICYFKQVFSSHFHLLLQYHWANFNQTWHKAPLGEGDSRYLKEGPALFQEEIITK